MADPILISQIISSLGLTGQEAETKRQELEKLSNDELNKLIANISSFSPTSLGGFSSLEKQNKFNGNVFQNNFVDNASTSFSTSQNNQTKEYSRQQQKELDKFLGDFLYNSASSGLQTIKNYNDSIGILNITDRAVNGFKVLTGQQDRIGFQEQMSKEVEEAQKLQKAAYSQPGAFESKVERKFGVPYSHSNVEQLKTASEEFTRVSAYHDKVELLEQGFAQVKTILSQEQEYAQAKKYVKGAAAASLTPPEVSSHEKFGEVLLQFCNGDQNLVNEYMKNLSSSMGSRAEIEKNLPQIMDELLTKCKSQEQEALGGKSFSQYEQEYNTACKKVFGTKDYKQTAQNFVNNAKTQAAYTEVGLTIATSLLLPGSSAVKSGMQKAALKYGEKAATQGFKAAMTFGTGSMPAVLSTLNAATSKEGFTPEKIEEIKEKFKNGLVYGGFGAYASGPLGNAVEKVLSKNPTMLSNIVSKTMGTATETSADIIFDRITSDLSFTESLKQNGVMNFGMMIAGGRIAKGSDNSLSSLKVAKNNDGSFSVKDSSGNVVFNAKDENALAGFVMAKGLNNEYCIMDVNQSAEINPDITDAPHEIQYKINLSNGRQISLMGPPNLTRQQLTKMVIDFLEKEKIKDVRKIHYAPLKPAFEKTTDKIYKTRMLDIDNLILQFEQNPQAKKTIDKMLEEFNKTGNYETIDQLELYLEAISELNGKSVKLYDYQERTINGKTKHVNEFSYINLLAKEIKEVDNSSLTEWQKQLNNKKIPGSIKKGGHSINGDMKFLMQWHSAIRYMKKYPNTDIANHFYDLYLNFEKKKIPESYISKIKDINDKYGVKIILPTSFYLEQGNKTLEIIQAELSKWKKASDGEAKLPPVIMFNAANPTFHYKLGQTKNMTTVAGSEASYGGTLVFLGLAPENITSLRHELTHTNDLKLGENIPEKYNLDEIIPHKEVVGPYGIKQKVLPKIEECKYADEFRNAGLADSRIQYAHTNTKEFIAVATEGDMSKYSPEFKQVLIDFGMPEWMFKMDVSN